MYEEQHTQATQPKKKKRFSKKSKTVLIAVIAAVLLLGGAGYYIYQQNQKIDRLSDPQQAAKDEAARVKDLVSALADVPADEEPTVATVNDAEKLKSQTFFRNAENGDKVLIFTKAKKAYLYRPSTNKLIEVAPISIGDNKEGSSSNDNSDSNNSADDSADDNQTDDTTTQ